MAGHDPLSRFASRPRLPYMGLAGPERDAHEHFAAGNTVDAQGRFRMGGSNWRFEWLHGRGPSESYPTYCQ